jgi:hypothetical protein
MPKELNRHDTGPQDTRWHARTAGACHIPHDSDHALDIAQYMGGAGQGMLGFLLPDRDDPWPLFIPDADVSFVLEVRNVDTDRPQQERFVIAVNGPTPAIKSADVTANPD